MYIFLNIFDILAKDNFSQTQTYYRRTNKNHPPQLILIKIFVVIFAATCHLITFSSHTEYVKRESIVLFITINQSFIYQYQYLFIYLLF